MSNKFNIKKMSTNKVFYMGGNKIIFMNTVHQVANFLLSSHGLWDWKITTVYVSSNQNYEILNRQQMHLWMCDTTKDDLCRNFVNSQKVDWRRRISRTGLFKIICFFLFALTS